MNKFKHFLFKSFCTTNSSHSQAIISATMGQSGNILGLYMNTPKNRNALSRSMIDSLKSHITQVNSNHYIRAVILMSQEPGYFCSGADLKERQRMNEKQTEEFVKELRETFQLLSELRVPSICGIDGFALGGGLELSLSTDIRICTKSSTLGLTECSLGIIPGAGGTQRLPRLIGVARAKEMVFTSERINGEKALSIGLVNHVVDKYEELESKSLEIAEKIARNAPLAVVNAKKAIQEGIGYDIKAGLDVETRCYGNIIRTEDRVEGLKAFLEKRAPNYQGK